MIPSISKIPLGLSARGCVFLTSGGVLTRFVFRVRRNNGSAGGIAGKLYQDCYTFVTTTYCNSPAQQADRSTFSAGVSAWQALTELQKDAYRKRATRTKHATGFTLFMSEYLYSHPT